MLFQGSCVPTGGVWCVVCVCGVYGVWCVCVVCVCGVWCVVCVCVVCVVCVCVCVCVSHIYYMEDNMSPCTLTYILYCVCIG